MSVHEPVEDSLPETSAPHASAPPVRKTLSMTGGILGIISVTTFYVPFWGPGLALAALVLGIVAKSKKEPRRAALFAIIVGLLGLVVSIGAWVWLYAWFGTL